MADETLKEYLVKIGWNVDGQGYNKAKNLVTSLFSKLSKGASSIGPLFSKAGKSVVGTILDITEATIDLASETAKLDQKTEHWARQYWTTEQNARSLQTVLSTMGLNDINDLAYATNEEFSRFLELRDFGKSLEAPKELDGFLVKIRDIQQEFNKFKVMLSYGKRWVVYYLGQMFGGDVEDILAKLRNAVSWLREHVPEIAKKVATYIGVVIRIVKTFYTVCKTTVEFIRDVLNRIPGETKASLAALSVVILAFLSGPVGMLILAIGTIILLIDDFLAWKRGALSVFDWSGLQDIFDGIDFEETKDDLAEIAKSVGEIFAAGKDILEDILNSDIFKWFVNTAIDLIKDGVQEISNLFNDIKNIWQWIKDQDLSILNLSKDKEESADEGKSLKDVREKQASNRENISVKKSIGNLWGFSQALASGGGILGPINKWAERKAIGAIASIASDWFGNKDDYSKGVSNVTNKMIDNSKTEVNLTVNAPKNDKDKWTVNESITKNADYSMPIVN